MGEFKIKNMKIYLILLYITSIISITIVNPDTRAIVGLEIKTRDILYGGTNDRVSLSICDHESKCCYLDDVDNPKVDDHEPGHIDGYTENDLKGCNHFQLKSVYKIVAEVSG